MLWLPCAPAALHHLHCAREVVFDGCSNGRKGWPLAAEEDGLGDRGVDPDWRGREGLLIGCDVAQLEAAAKAPAVFVALPGHLSTEKIVNHEDTR